MSIESVLDSAVPEPSNAGAVISETNASVININIGILGHVDSGKTSLVKALSTLLSTAALDKNPQSRERGITLDLGFSAFSRPLPPRIQLQDQGKAENPSSHLDDDKIEKSLAKSLPASSSPRLRDDAIAMGYSEHSILQYTLVDCPGHASLIRTIIGGAQIIDMMILVIDINKGIQTQTAECLVIGEITTKNMIIALNKVDLIPIEEREEKIEKAIKRIQKSFKTTKFPDPPIVITSACTGGEKVAAITSTSSKSEGNITYGIDDLYNLIESTVKIPARNKDGSFLYAIDHCFPIKGHGTVMTGTVLSGSVAINSSIEIPQLQLTRKVKSIQMFRKPVKHAIQGDRIALCVTSIDATLVERGIACQPGSVSLAHALLCQVKKIRFFRYPCRSGAKYHISIGHTTVVATVYFFGAKELAMKTMSSSTSTSASSTSIAYDDIMFDWNEDFEKQDELILHEENFIYGRETMQWAILRFQQPVYCPSRSLIIGSRLDTDVSEGSSLENVCRIAFSGQVHQYIPEHAIDTLNIYNMKSKEAVVFKLTDTKAGICRELIAWRLGNPVSTYIEPYIGMTVQSETGYLGIISGLYGSDGKFKVKFPDGARLSVGSKLMLKYKKYTQNDRKISQVGIIYDKPMMMSIEGSDVPMNLIIKATKDVVVDDNQVAAGDVKVAVAKVSSESSQPPLILNDCHITSTSVSTSVSTASSSIRIGKIESVKKVDDSHEYIVIITGAFTMEENIRVYAGSAVNAIGLHQYEGKLIGPYAKLGKCKVNFGNNDNIASCVGEEVHIHLNN